MEKVEKLNNFILKNILFVIVVIIILYLFAGMGGSKVQPIQDEAQYDMVAPRAMAINNSAPMMMGVRAKGFSDTKMVKTFSLSIETKNINKVKNDILDKINEDGGIIDGFYTYNYFGNELAYNYTLRIPTDKIDAAIIYFKSLGIIKNESSSGIDMGEQYADNQSRLTNLYARRDRLRKMMESKTEKLADVIAVDRELSNVQNEIEALENTNKNIDNNVLYSRLELSILPEVKVDNFNNSKWQVGTAWKQAVNDSILFGQKTIDFVFRAITFIPIIIVLLVIFIVIKVIIVKIAKRN